MKEPTKEEMLAIFDEITKNVYMTNREQESVDAIRALISQPPAKTVTREQFQVWTDQVYLCTEEEAPKVLASILADLGITVEEKP